MSQIRFITDMRCGTCAAAGHGVRPQVVGAQHAGNWADRLPGTRGHTQEMMLTCSFTCKPGGRDDAFIAS
jgi:hypothetical protein